jgi:glycosyltransferase involved in cell wall biosynthesis
MIAAVRRPPRELPVIPIGVDVDRFLPDPSHRSGQVALGVGLIARFKRWHLAVRGLMGSGISLRIVGPIADPAYAAELRAMGTEVVLLGEVDDPRLQHEFAAADFLVHPSQVELLAGVVLQGLSAGLPLIGASPVAGLAEESVSGWCAPPGSSDDQLVQFIRDHAVRLAGDRELRERASLAARARAISEFSWDSVVARHLALYERLLGARALDRSNR